MSVSEARPRLFQRVQFASDWVNARIRPEAVQPECARRWLTSSVEHLFCWHAGCDGRLYCVAIYGSVVEAVHTHEVEHLAEAAVDGAWCTVPGRTGVRWLRPSQHDWAIGHQRWWASIGLGEQGTIERNPLDTLWKSYPEAVSEVVLDLLTTILGEPDGQAWWFSNDPRVIPASLVLG